MDQSSGLPGSRDGSVGYPSRPSSERGSNTPEPETSTAAVAKAPTNVSLYESLLRYHEDDSDDEQSRLAAAAAEEDDRKPAAKPAAKPPAQKTVVQRQPISRPYSNRNMMVEEVSSKELPSENSDHEPGEKSSSFYKSALEAAERESGKTADSALYQATSGLIDPTVSNVLSDEEYANSLMTAETRKMAQHLDDDVIAIQEQMSALSAHGKSSNGFIDPEAWEKPSEDVVKPADADPEQVKLWLKIKEEQERKQLEEALMMSKKEAGGGTVDFVPNEALADIPRELLGDHYEQQEALRRRLNAPRNPSPTVDVPDDIPRELLGDPLEQEEALRRLSASRNKTPTSHVPDDIPVELLGDPREQEEALRRLNASRNQPPVDRSRRDDPLPASVPPRESAADFMISQQLAMEEWRAMHGKEVPMPGGPNAAGCPGMGIPSDTIDRPAVPSKVPQPTQRPRPGDPPRPTRPPPLRESNELLRQGHYETREAISNGTAHVVKCQGCGSRLHAPISYSLVFCPNCETVSPGLAARATTDAGAERQPPRPSARRGRRQSNPR